MGLALHWDAARDGMDKKEAGACVARGEGAMLQHTDGAADRDGPRYQDRDQVLALHAVGHDVWR
jgi:hypothetical protein